MKTFLSPRLGWITLLLGALAVVASASEANADKVLTEKLGYTYDPHVRDVKGAPAAVLMPAVEPPEVMMDRLVVTAKKLNLEPHEMLTDRGRMKEAQKKYLSPVYQKTFGPLAQLAGYYFNWLSILGGWHPNESEAALFAEQDEIVRIRTRLAELEQLDRVGR